MQTKYPKKQKIKQIVTKKNQDSFNNILTEQQKQIDNLKADENKKDISIEYLEAKSKMYDQAYYNTLSLQQNVNDINNQTSSVNNRLNAIDLQLKSIVQVGQTNTVDLSQISAEIQNNKLLINENINQINQLKNIDLQQTEQINNLQQQITFVQDDLLQNTISQAELNQVYDAIYNNAQDIQDVNNNLGGQIAQNTQDISQLKLDVVTASENADIALNNTEKLQTDLKDNKNQTTQNTITLSNLQKQVEFNTQKLANIQNGSTSSGGTSLDLVDLTKRVDINEQNIANIQLQQDLNTSDIATLIKFKERFDTVPDTTYNPKSYSDFPAGTIVQTYACYERELELFSTNLITTTKAYFLAEPQSLGTLKLHLDLCTTELEQEVLIETYLNDVLIGTNIVGILPETKTYSVDFYDIPLNTQTKQNTVYCKLKPNPSKRFYLYNLKIELLAPNADLIPITKPYNVEYIDGKYYVSDCSDGTAKLAIIQAQNMYNMQNLTFEDKGVDAQAMYVGAGTKNYNNVYMFDNFAEAYIKKDDYLHFTDTVNGKANKNTNYKFIDWLQNKNTNIMFLTNSYTDLKPKYSTIYYSSGSMGTGTIKSPVTNVVRTYGVKFFGDINDLVNSYTCTSITGDGQVYVTHSNSDKANQTINLGYGTIARLYYHYLNTINDYGLNVFVKKFDKIVKYNLTFNSTSGYTINSITELGSYDDFFLGAKNDYFAVKNGKLNYHLLPDNTITN